MAYDHTLEEQIDKDIHSWKGKGKRKMFGGVCYLINGNMCFGITKDYLIVRTGAKLATEKLKEEHIKPFDITGRPMKAWVMVAKKGWARAEDLKYWLAVGRDFALSLPVKF